MYVEYMEHMVLSNGGVATMRQDEESLAVDTVYRTSADICITQCASTVESN